MSEDTSMDILVEAYLNDPTYELEDGRKITVRKVTTRDYPMVLSLVRKIITYVQTSAGKPIAGQSPAQAQKMAEDALAGASVVDVIEENMPTVLQTIETLTDLTPEEVQDVTLGDLLGIGQKIWAINQRFFTQVMALMQGFGQSTPQPVLQPVANPAPKRRTRKR